MDQQKSNKRGVTAIVPAYNEEERIGKVLDVLMSCDFLKEVIVVDDGSTDKTGEIAKKFPVRYIAVEKNGGKGKAMERGVQESKTEIVFFCDADVRGLTKDVVKEIITPVVNGEVEMCIGMRNRKSYALRFVLAFVPLVGGERALTKELWQMVPEYYKERFRIEAGLNFYAKYYGKGLRFRVFKNLAQTIKEKKYGIWPGLRARVGMFRDYLQAFFKLQFTEIPKSVLNRRVFLLSYFFSFLAFVFGLLMFVAIWYGPRRFVLDIFADDLQREKSTPLIQFYLSIASNVSIDILSFIAFLIVGFNVFIILVNSKKLVLFLKQYYDKWQISFLSPQRMAEKEIVGDKKI